MNLSLQDFKYNLIDVNRPNRFIVQILAPFIQLDQNISYTVMEAKVPNYQITEIPIKFLGQTVHYRGNSTFAPMEMTFVDDINNVARQNLITWMSYIRDFSSPLSASSINTYLNASVILNRYDLSNDVNMTYTFNNVLPVEMTETNLSMTKNSEAATFSLKFLYSYYKVQMSSNYNKSYINSISPFYTGSATNLKGLLQEIGLSSILGSAANSVENSLTDLLNAPLNTLGSGLNSILQNLIGGGTIGVENPINTLNGTAQQGVGGVLQEILPSVVGGGNNIISGIENTVSSIANSIGGLL